ncbi:unnamed protein product [Ascophyllum nodosum]
MAQFRARTKAGWGTRAAPGEDHRTTISAESEGGMMVGDMSPEDKQALLDKEDENKELRETNQLLRLKIAKLEQLLRLKDAKIRRLSDAMEDAGMVP